MQTVSNRLDETELKGREEMIDPTITKVIQDLDAATTAVATRIQKLIDSIAAAGQVSAKEIVAALQPEVDRLNAMGSDGTTASISG